ncbi:hypothetical protein RFM68_31155 [Mesorhizobium sp. MSK_1335]|uniref:DNA-binding protein n=1 Tax=Mesorhizobium montanum TaxID=3072323 RepID=A0ABU4ZVA0_9HYPH|nr:hypothetical protein [Mesorhizobium sp. MSK_1335]MDX8528937.1 hypothetical protein [Mesorhizobium sp. MSK_1335]
MSTERDQELQTAKEKHVTWLVVKTGITYTQAHELIDLLGVGNLPSLVREALLLLKK